MSFQAILAFLSNCLHRRLWLRGSCQLLLGEQGWCCSPATTWKWLLFKWIPAAASQHSSVELNTTVASCGRALFWSEYWHEMSHVFRTASKLNELNCPNSPQIKKKKIKSPSLLVLFTLKLDQNNFPSCWSDLLGETSKQRSLKTNHPGRSPPHVQPP